MNLGEMVKLIKVNSRCHKNRRGGFIPTGTLGHIMGIRDIGKGTQYLVKFEGHGGVRHTEVNEIERLS